MINGSMSSWMEVKSGVLQGTIFGPLLSIIYINDIDVGLSSNVGLFADDCAIYRNVTLTKDCEILQNDLHLLYSWALKWQLKLNISKCKALQVTLTRKPLVFTYKFLGHNLDRVDFFLFLGISISKNLSWSSQCEHAAARANKVLGMLKHNMKGGPQDTKLQEYLMLVRPHLEYCIQTWSRYYEKDREILERVQHRATYWTAGCTWNKVTHQWSKTYDQCLSELALPTVAQHHHFLLCLQTFKIVHCLDCINYSVHHASFVQPITAQFSLHNRNTIMTHHTQLYSASEILTR